MNEIYACLVTDGPQFHSNILSLIFCACVGQRPTADCSTAVAFLSVHPYSCILWKRINWLSWSECWVVGTLYSYQRLKLGKILKGSYHHWCWTQVGFIKFAIFNQYHTISKRYKIEDRAIKIWSELLLMPIGSLMKADIANDVECLWPSFCNCWVARRVARIAEARDCATFFGLNFRILPLA